MRPGSWFLLGVLTGGMVASLFWLGWRLYAQSLAGQMPLPPVTAVKTFYRGHKLLDLSEPGRVQELMRALPRYSAGLPYATRCCDDETYFVRFEHADQIPTDAWLPLDDCLVICPKWPRYSAGYTVAAPSFLALLGREQIEAAGPSPYAKCPFLNGRVISRWQHWVRAATARDIPGPSGWAHP